MRKAKQDKADYLRNIYTKFDFVADKRCRSAMRSFTTNKKHLLFLTVSPPKNPEYYEISQLVYEVKLCLSRHHIDSLWVTEFNDRRIHFHGLIDISVNMHEIEYYTTTLKDLTADRCFIDLRPVVYLTGMITYMTKDVYLNRDDGFEPIGRGILQIPAKDWKPTHWIRECNPIEVESYPPTHSTPPHASPHGGTGGGLSEEDETTHPCGVESDDVEDHKNEQF